MFSLRIRIGSDALTNYLVAIRNASPPTQAPPCHAVFALSMHDAAKRLPRLSPCRMRVQQSPQSTRTCTPYTLHHNLNAETPSSPSATSSSSPAPLPPPPALPLVFLLCIRNNRYAAYLPALFRTSQPRSYDTCKRKIILTAKKKKKNNPMQRIGSIKS